MDGKISKLSNILKEYVSEKRKTNPKISESQIARNLGVSNTTFYRITNYHTYPSVKNLLKLCRFIPKLKAFVTDGTLEAIRRSKSGKYTGKELENLLRRRNLFITYALALSSHGVTDEEIIYCIGLKGIQALKTLTAAGFITKTKDNRYQATKSEKGTIRSFEVIKKHLEILAANYNPDNIANNYIYYKIESLNEKGLQKIHEIYKETHKEIQEIMEQEEYQGDIPIFSAGFFDMFFIKIPENKRKKE